MCGGKGPQTRTTIIASGGMSVPYDWGSTAPLLIERASLDIARGSRVGFIGTASGDKGESLVGFYSGFGKLGCEVSHLRLFEDRNHDEEALEKYLLNLDLIWVGGGNTAAMLAVWRAFRIDRMLRKAWHKGIVLAGMSAGAICWHEGGSTDSYGPTLRPYTEGLGFIKGSCFPHYDGEEQRRPKAHEFVESKQLKSGIAIDDYAAVIYQHDIPPKKDWGRADIKMKNAEMRIITAKEGKTAYEVKLKRGKVVETPLPATYIGPTIKP